MRPPLPPRGPVSRHPRVSSSPLGWGQLPFGDVTGPPLGFESGGPSACSASDQAPPTCGPGPGTWLRSWGARSEGVVEAPGFPVGTGVTALPLAWGSLGLRPQERSPPSPTGHQVPLARVPLAVRPGSGSLGSKGGRSTILGVVSFEAHVGRGEPGRIWRYFPRLWAGRFRPQIPAMASVPSGWVFLAVHVYPHSWCFLPPPGCSLPTMLPLSRMKTLSLAYSSCLINICD